MFQILEECVHYSNVVLRTVFSCFANSQDFNQLCCSYGVSVMCMNFKTRGSATAEEPRDTLRQLKYYGRF